MIDKKRMKLTIDVDELTVSPIATLAHCFNNHTDKHYTPFEVDRAFDWLSSIITGLSSHEGSELIDRETITDACERLLDVYGVGENNHKPIVQTTLYVVKSRLSNRGWLDSLTSEEFAAVYNAFSYASDVMDAEYQLRERANKLPIL